MDSTATAPRIDLPAGPSASSSGRSVNWGGVLKGAAIVTGVVVAGVVGFYAFSALAGYTTAAIAASPTASSIAVGIGNVATWGASMLGNAVGIVWGGLGQAGTLALNAMGLGGVHWAGAAATTHTMGIVGAGAATAVAAHAAAPHVHALQLGADVPMDPTGTPAADSTISSGIFAAQGAQTAAHTASLHEVTHAAHHAAESTSEADHKSWVSQFANKAGFTIHTDAVRASQAEKSISPRADNFAEQLNADRANLDHALAK